MTVEELVTELGLLPPDSEVLLSYHSGHYPVCRVEDDSQGVYLISDPFASSQEEWNALSCV